MKIGTRESHPAADVFPLLEGDEYEEFRNGIKEHGLLNEIWIDTKGRILDGRNRERACLEIGVEPRYRVYNGDDPIGFIWEQNDHRRHSTVSVRAMSAAKLATLSRGQRISKSAPGADLTQADAAKLMGVGERTVQRAAAVLENATPEVVEQVQTGKLSLKDAEAIVRPQRERPVPAPSDPRARDLATWAVDAFKSAGCSVRYENTTNEHAAFRVAIGGRVYRVEVIAE
jgi:hypothetical protein